MASGFLVERELLETAIEREFPPARRRPERQDLPVAHQQVQPLTA
jgi:hypothetical protein